MFLQWKQNARHAWISSCFSFSYISSTFWVSKRRIVNGYSFSNARLLFFTLILEDSETVSESKRGTFYLPNYSTNFTNHIIPRHKHLHPHLVLFISSVIAGNLCLDVLSEGLSSECGINSKKEEFVLNSVMAGQISIQNALFQSRYPARKKKYFDALHW